MAYKEGSITTSTTAVTFLNTDGCQFALVTISGTYGSVQAAFEGSNDGGTTWYATGIIKASDLATVQSATGALSDNSSNAWLAPISGWSQFRVRATAWASGSASVKISGLLSVGAIR